MSDHRTGTTGDSLSEEERSLLQSILASDSSASAAAIGRRTSFPGSVASSAQRGLWFLNQLDGATAAYHVPLVFRIAGRLDISVLESALAQLVERHEPLRTVFRQLDGELHQHVLEPFKVSLSRYDLTVFTHDIGEQRLAESIQTLAKEPFFLAQGPLIRGAFFQVKPEAQVLLLNLHHAVVDAWSGDLLFAELMEIYRRMATGEPPLPPLALQYADYAEWQHGKDRSGSYEASLAYWKKKLSSLTPLALPGDRPRPAVRTSQGEKVFFHLPKEVTEDLTELCRGRGTTLFVGLVTVFKILLHRLTGQTDIAIGSGSASRGRPELLDMVGLFLNNLVLRTDLTGDPTFEELGERVRDTVWDGLEHQEVPFEKILAALNVERSAEPNPLFQVVFTYNERSVPTVELPGASVALSDPNLVEVGSAKHDLSVHCWNSPQGVSGVFEFSRDIFDRATMERFVSYFGRLARQVVANPRLPISRYVLMGAEERSRVLFDWNQSQRAVSGETFLAQFAATVERSAEAAAVVCGRETLTFGELNEKSVALAGRLVGAGLTPERPVAVCLGRNQNLPVAFVGILKAGGVYFPLDISQPTERLKAMVEAAEPFAVLCEGETLPLAQALGAVCIRADQGEDIPGPLPEVLSAQAAYLLFTSGSTGKPKGVTVEHRSLGHLVEWAKSAYGLRNGDRGGFLTNIGFDPTIEELAAYLGNGVTLCIGSDELRLSPPDLKRWIVEQRLTVCQLPAPVLETILDDEWPADFALRIFLTGGDRLRKRPRPGVSFVVINRYGPTECTVYCTQQRIGGAGDRPGSIGRPIANTQIYLLDAQRQPVPTGVVGEIYVGGIPVARGYWGDPKRTAESFVPDPFGANPNGKLYRTGDLARFHGDGTIEFLGRADGQVKIRGMRIELGEVESVLKTAPGLADGLVAIRQGNLVAYVVPRGSFDEEGLRSFLRQRLPEAMVPTRWVAVSSIPLTPNGKVDLARLPEPELPPPALVQMPAGEIASAIARVWGDILGLSAVGLNQNFFDLGGHSLLLSKVQSKLSAVLQKEIKLTDLLRHPTVGALAKALGETGREAAQRQNSLLEAARARAANRRKGLKGI